ncbi:uncharacterized protein EAF02_000611 [Botrytis sinoallii]|uniref:uncharacterized protein n=1 Tax=Botrytis sinoallii TaxID=1463999 RepID=UPI0018FFBB48|nr:uncharacterized protein EAF02_000611 [Botrytis sinoallii]KAF7893073.1 hypothetical protein EAF02_000611 [Botrytis sinoallii]
MVKLSVCLLLGGFSALASALPAAAPVPTAAPDLDKRATTCTFSGSGGASSASKSKTSCSTIVLSALAVPSGTTLDLTGLTEGTTVIFEGITTFGYEEWSGPLVSVSGTNITVTQSTGAYLDGAELLTGMEKVPTEERPNQNSFTHTTWSPQRLRTFIFTTHPSNTSVTITGANVYNQDDCVAINSGTGITFSGGVCSGGHGLSIGSVGGRDDNIVETVLFESSEIKDSQNGIRIKTISGDTGTVSGITYSGITLSGITDYGITVNQAYDGTSGEPTNGVTISKFILENITGTVESTATNILIECGSGSCTDWTWTDVSITGGKSSSDCLNVPTSGGVSCSL